MIAITTRSSTNVKARFMRRILRLIVCCVGTAGIIVPAGCGSKSPEIKPADSKSVDSKPAESKPGTSALAAHGAEIRKGQSRWKNTRLIPQANRASPRRNEARQLQLPPPSLQMYSPSTVSSDFLRSYDWPYKCEALFGTRMRMHAPAQCGIANCQCLVRGTSTWSKTAKR